MTDGIPRVHPLAFVALLEAAHATGIKKLNVSSGWRPLLGQTPHRAGLGLDIDYLETESGAVRINREALYRIGKSNSDNVSETERQLHAAYEKQVVASKVANQEYTAAIHQVEMNTDPDKKASLKDARQLAEEANKGAQDQVKSAQKAWLDECKANEPIAVRTLRAKLQICNHVHQLLDPWYIDIDTHDKVSPLPNWLRKIGGLERLHANHLHITVYDPKLL